MPVRNTIRAGLVSPIGSCKARATRRAHVRSSLHLASIPQQTNLCSLRAACVSTRMCRARLSMFLSRSCRRARAPVCTAQWFPGGAPEWSRFDGGVRERSTSACGGTHRAFAALVPDCGAGRRRNWCAISSLAISASTCIGIGSPGALTALSERLNLIALPGADACGAKWASRALRDVDRVFARDASSLLHSRSFAMSGMREHAARSCPPPR
jgi:hypothetical protein